MTMTIPSITDVKDFIINSKDANELSMLEVLIGERIEVLDDIEMDAYDEDDDDEDEYDDDLDDDEDEDDFDDEE